MITFSFIDIRFRIERKSALTAWLEACAKKEKRAIESLNYNFTSDKYLLKMNKQYLAHSTYTDIITFDLADSKAIEGDVYISWERVKENAKEFKIPAQDELRRVLAHGLLHLCGYKDKTPADAKLMRKKENECLTLWNKTNVPRGIGKQNAWKI